MAAFLTWESRTGPDKEVSETMRIFVGNISFDTTKEALTEAFAAFGEVADLHLPTDRETGKPRGFAFVEMRDDEQAKAAIEGVNGRDMDGRALTVNEARPREESASPRGPGGGAPRSSGGFNAFGGGGGGGGRRPRRGGGGRGRDKPAKGDNAARRPI